MTIAKRLILTSGAPLALLAVLGGVSIFNLTQVSDSLHEIVTGPLPGVLDASQIDGLVFQFRGDTWKHIAFTDGAGKAAIERNQQDLKKKIADHFANYEKTALTPEDRALIAKARPLCE